MSKRLRAYGMLVHHALNELAYAVEDQDVRGCCPECCASCEALMILDKEGVLDSVVSLWDTHEDGTAVLTPGNPSWWTGTQVDRDWLYAAWTKSTTGCAHSK